MRTWTTALVLLGLAAVCTGLAPGLRADEEEGEPEQPAAEPAYVPKELAPSWRDQAQAAYGKKAWADAIFLYRKWLEADPHDEASWYNLACTYALAGQKDAALEALETAVDAGWKDGAWPKEDPDLEILREERRFLEALERCEEAKAKGGPSSFVRHWIPIPAIGTYLALLPPDYAEDGEERYPLVVVLHGNGSSEMGHGRVGDTGGREGVIYVVPRAPYPHEQVFRQLRRPGWTWAPQDAGESELEHLEPAKRYVDSVLAAVEDARMRYCVADGKIFVFGHSMGGFFTNTLCMLHPEKVQAAFAYAGGLPEESPDPEALARMKEHGVKIWHVHGRADPTVPSSRSAEAHLVMKGAGVDSELHLFDEVDHGIRPPVAELLQRWIRELVRGIAAKVPPEDEHADG